MRYKMPEFILILWEVFVIGNERERESTRQSLDIQIILVINYFFELIVTHNF